MPRSEGRLEGALTIPTLVFEADQEAKPAPCEPELGGAVGESAAHVFLPLPRHLEEQIDLPGAG